MVVQKKLLDREHTLYKTLLGHWRNTSALAASGLSLNFSSEDAENIESQVDHDDEEYGKAETESSLINYIQNSEL